MRRVLFNILLLILISSSCIIPQQFSTGSPEWLVDMFFRQSSFVDKSYYYTGEMISDVDKPTIGEEIKGRGEALFHQIKATNNECVFTAELNVDDKIMDFYCYLIKQEEGWKINAIRRFLLPDFVYTVFDSLSKLSSLSSADSALYLSLKLFIMNDSQLKSFLITHSKDLDNLVWYFNQQENEEVDRRLTAMGFNAMFRDKSYPGCIFIQIAALEKMESGLIYVVQPSKLPVVSIKDFVYIEEVLPGWFIYRIM